MCQFFFFKKNFLKKNICVFSFFSAEFWVCCITVSQICLLLYNLILTLLDSLVLTLFLLFLDLVVQLTNLVFSIFDYNESYSIISSYESFAFPEQCFYIDFVPRLILLNIVRQSQNEANMFFFIFHNVFWKICPLFRQFSIMCFKCSRVSFSRSYENKKTFWGWGSTISLLFKGMDFFV